MWLQLVALVCRFFFSSSWFSSSKAVLHSSHEGCLSLPSSSHVSSLNQNPPLIVFLQPTIPSFSQNHRIKIASGFEIWKTQP
ncbi:hypothetical protein I3760_02G183000 [Carya illinoinensis]|nr:hypothetical protein I3760_02G183000 [Carya illinoinensis]